MTKWVTGNVLQVKYWTDRLFSLIIQASVDPFIAGQFTKLGLEIQGERIQRAYSYVNAPSNKNLEFYLVTIPEGKLSIPLHTLQPGDKLLISKKASGIFVLDEIPKCENLWMLATGTAIGPYLSMLEQGLETWENIECFRYIILVHAVRYSKDLSYLPKMLELQKKYNGRLRIQTVVSREEKVHVASSLTGHLPTLITDGSLEDSVNLRLDPNNSHVMLCGNPNMVHDTKKLLQESRGMRHHFKLKPGHITIENYW